MPDSDPVQNYVLNFRKQKKENLAWHSRRQASRRLMRIMFQVRQASKRLVRIPSVIFLQSSVLVHSKNHSYDRKEVESYSCHFFVWVDQDERQCDAALHWDTIKPALLKAFGKDGAQNFSEKHWLRLIQEESSKTGFENCEDSKNSLAYCRAVQKHF